LPFTPLDNWRQIRNIQKIQYEYDKKRTDNNFLSNGAGKLAELDTTILSYNREYPNVGFPISQATEFDHRLSEVVAENKTSADGSFKIENVPEGSPCEIIECFDINRVETDKNYFNISSIVANISQGEPCEINIINTKGNKTNIKENLVPILANLISISQGESHEINNSSISRGGYNFVAQKQGFGWNTFTLLDSKHLTGFTSLEKLMHFNVWII